MFNRSMEDGLHLRTEAAATIYICVYVYIYIFVLVQAGTKQMYETSMPGGERERVVSIGTSAVHPVYNLARGGVERYV